MDKKLMLRSFAIAFLVLVVSILLTVQPSDHSETEKNTEAPLTEDRYEIKLSDMQVMLFKNGDPIKTYDIQPSILPGEDILLLTNGIKVESEAEADLRAEDFDG